MSPQFAAKEKHMFIVLGCNSKPSGSAVAEILRTHKFNRTSHSQSGWPRSIWPMLAFMFLGLGRDSVCKLLQRSLAGLSIAFACPIGQYLGNAVRCTAISAAQAVYFDYCCVISLEAAAYCTKCAVYAPTLWAWAVIGGKYGRDFHGFS